MFKHTKKYSKFVYLQGGKDGIESGIESGDEGGEKAPDKAAPTADEAAKKKEQAADMAAGAEGSLVKLEKDPEFSQTEEIGEDELKKMSKGYPEQKIDTAKERDIVAEMVRRVKKKSGGKIEHRDVDSLMDTDLTDGYEYVLVYDVHHSPKERLFKNPKKVEVKEKKEDPTPVVREFLEPGYKELTSKDKYYSAAMTLKSKLKRHGDAQSYYPTKADDPLLVLVKDDNSSGGYRAFEGKPVA